jgi:hypothetical protein
MQTDNEWIPFKFIFSDKKSGSMDGGLGFMFILVQRIKANKEINFISSKTASSFKMFPDLVVIKRTTTYAGEVVSEETIVKEEAKKVPEDDLTALMVYFELIGMKKMIDSIKEQEVGRLMTKSFNAIANLRTGEDPPKSGFADMMGSVNLVTQAWSGIVSAFKTTKTNTVKEKIQGQGYDKMFSTSMTDRIEGLEAAYITEYLDDFKSIVQLPNNKDLQDALYNSVKYAKYSTAKTFNGNSLAFTKENGGKTVFVTFMHRKNRADNTYNIIWSYFSAEFSLAPDIWVWNKGLSVLGGIYSNNEDYVKYVPRSLTEADIKSLMNFMEMMNFKSLYASLGVGDLQLPAF